MTGGTSGIGFETARILARCGARVMVTGRDVNRGEAAASLLQRDGGGTSVTFLQAVHATVGGNQQLATQVRAACTGLDVLVNNVGGLNDRRKTTADGYGHTLAMNFVGPFALTAELLPLLRANAPSRCVNVISAAFTMYKRDPFTEVQAEESFVGSDVYAHTKLLNLLLDLRWRNSLRMTGSR